MQHSTHITCSSGCKKFKGLRKTSSRFFSMLTGFKGVIIFLGNLLVHGLSRPLHVFALTPANSQPRPTSALHPQDPHKISHVPYPQLPLPSFTPFLLLLAFTTHPPLLPCEIGNYGGHRKLQKI